MIEKQEPSHEAKDVDSKICCVPTHNFNHDRMSLGSFLY